MIGTEEIGVSAIGTEEEASTTPGGGSCDPADIWGYILPNGKTAQATLVEVHAMVSELYQVHGLQVGSPLSVTQTQRTAGDVTQTISEAGGTVTVTRA